jgi:hypothetical protein
MTTRVRIRFSPGGMGAPQRAHQGDAAAAPRRQERVQAFRSQACGVQWSKVSPRGSAGSHYSLPGAWPGLEWAHDGADAVGLQLLLASSFHSARPAPLPSLDSLELGVDLCTVAGVASPGLLPHRGPVRGGQSRSARCADSDADAARDDSCAPAAGVLGEVDGGVTAVRGGCAGRTRAGAACRRGADTEPFASGLDPNEPILLSTGLA